MNEDVKEFLERLIEELSDDSKNSYIKKEATQLLEKLFEEEVKETFIYHLTYKKVDIKLINNYCDFIDLISFYPDLKSFVLDNWEKLETIIKILKNEVKKEEEDNEQANN